eukprot:TRINITY_DN3967_c0_g1_i2.p1 TRINITY_DN3967_c0_g1~~TRINITY_DN3967_c0_g1_i2.p1  ORF type:complete len:209 (-),score=26.01 TRINITY_DN3967_c0_g1_i2:115-741(-)
MEQEGKHNQASQKAIIDTNHEEHPRNLIPQLCRQFYKLGWVTGTGGGISMRLGDEYYVAPSGVQKERIQSEDIFLLDKDANVLSAPPPEKNYKESQCTPLFWNAYTMRDVGAVIHTHSQHAMMVTLLFEKEFRITHQEMIKGIRIEILESTCDTIKNLSCPSSTTPRRNEISKNTWQKPWSSILIAMRSWSRDMGCMFGDQIGKKRRP